jgi:hypothetical protein
VWEKFNRQITSTRNIEIDCLATNGELVFHLFSLSHNIDYHQSIKVSQLSILINEIALMWVLVERIKVFVIKAKNHKRRRKKVREKKRNHY